ncbi:SAR2788 family putative toxin [Cerasibacillus sp. JNUCC 74]
MEMILLLFLTDLDTGEKYDVNTAEVQASWYPLVVVAIHVARHGIKWAIKKYGKKAVNKATKKYGKKASGKTLSKLKFPNLNVKWNKHKREFPKGLTKDGYKRRAQSLAGSTSKNVLSKKRKRDGMTIKYNKKTNEILFIDKNDVIQTFGIKYYKDQ